MPQLSDDESQLETSTYHSSLQHQLIRVGLQHQLTRESLKYHLSRVHHTSLNSHSLVKNRSNFKLLMLLEPTHKILQFLGQAKSV
jgi:hypothetical protein